MATLKFCAVGLLAAGALGAFGGCSGNVAAAVDCRVQCNDTHKICVQTCKDNTCTTRCTTDFDTCNASCNGEKTVVKDSGTRD